MPSNFVILSKKIKGYNNVLTTATKDMTFGVNKNVNYNKPQDTQNSTSRNTSHGNDSGDGGGAAFNDVALAGVTTITLILTMTHHMQHQQRNFH